MNLILLLTSLMQAASIAMAGIEVRLEHISALSPTSENSDYGVGDN